MPVEMVVSGWGGVGEWRRARRSHLTRGGLGSVTRSPTYLDPAPVGTGTCLRLSLIQ